MSEPVLPLIEAVRAFKRDYIRQAIVAAGGHRTKAAAALGIQRTYLRTLILDLGLTDLPSTRCRRLQVSA